MNNKLLEPISVSVKECEWRIGLGHTSVYQVIGRGELVAVKDGGKTKITMESIKRREANLPRAEIKRRKADTFA